MIQPVTDKEAGPVASHYYAGQGHTLFSVAYLHRQLTSHCHALVGVGLEDNRGWFQFRTGKELLVRPFRDDRDCGTMVTRLSFRSISTKDESCSRLCSDGVQLELLSGCHLRLLISPRTSFASIMMKDLGIYSCELKLCCQLVSCLIGRLVRCGLSCHRYGRSRQQNANFWGHVSCSHTGSIDLKVRSGSAKRRFCVLTFFMPHTRWSWRAFSRSSPNTQCVDSRRSSTAANESLAA